MHSTLPQAKPSAKPASKTELPPPNFITQVNKEDEPLTQQTSTGTCSKLYNCCSYIWKCLPFSSKEDSDFDQISEPSLPALLDPQLPMHKGRKCLVLDLDETLVHSTFEPVTNADLVLPVRIQGMTYKINVIKRPGCEEFLARMGELYEVVIFTASLSEYAEPLVKHLDQTGIVASILYRQHCTPMNGIYVKDMTLLGRSMKDIILVDNSPNSFLFQPENAYHIKNFFDDKRDRELVRLAHFLERIVRVPDVRPVEELRRKYEPEHINPKMMKFVKVDRHEAVDLDNSNSVVEEDVKKQAPLIRSRESQKRRSQELKQSAEMSELKEMKESKEFRDWNQQRAKLYSMTTEPDLRKDDREEEFQYYGSDMPEDDNLAGSNMFRGGALTERLGGSDRPSDTIEETELPSPKESDKLISNRSLLDKKKPLVPPLAKNKEAFSKLTRQNEDVVVVENKMIDGQKVEDVRLLTGKGNLNSPLGRMVKIDFNEEIAKRKKAKGV